jgi:hypothetical protein
MGEAPVQELIPQQRHGHDQAYPTREEWKVGAQGCAGREKKEKTTAEEGAGQEQIDEEKKRTRRDRFGPWKKGQAPWEGKIHFKGKIHPLPKRVIKPNLAKSKNNPMRQPWVSDQERNQRFDDQIFAMLNQEAQSQEFVRHERNKRALGERARAYAGSRCDAEEPDLAIGSLAGCPLPDSRYSLIHSRAIPDPDPYLYVGLCLICRRAMLGHISSGYTWFFVYH